jgi:hypothetical protein
MIQATILPRKRQSYVFNQIAKRSTINDHENNGLKEHNFLNHFKCDILISNILAKQHRITRTLLTKNKEKQCF